MFNKIIIICLLLVSFLQAATLNTDKEQYTSNENITVSFAEMTAKNKDWVAIYPANSNNDWVNVTQWRWTEDLENGNLNFNPMPAGDYEVRSFYNNSFITVATKQFSVVEGVNNAHINTNQDVYAPHENITVNFTGMTAKNKDWVGIYSAGSSNAWGNVKAWQWTGDTTNGNLNFEVLPIGDYEVRSFYNNSFVMVASQKFSVKANNELATLSTVKKIYEITDEVLIDFKNISGSVNDWLAIYPAGSSNDAENIIQKKTNVGAVKEGRANFDKLPTGHYEARVFFNNTFNLEASVAFEVQDNTPLTTLYENAEDGFNQAWFGTAHIINVGAAGSTHSVRVARTGGGFSFNNPPSKMKYLIFDTRVGTASHMGNFGVKVNTNKGTRRIVFESYKNHPGNDFSGHAVFAPPSLYNNYLQVHPGPTDYYLATRRGTFIHYKINIEEKLQLVEPDIKLISFILFTSAGGDFDNIKLSSN